MDAFDIHNTHRTQKPLKENGSFSLYGPVEFIIFVQFSDYCEDYCYYYFAFGLVALHSTVVCSMFTSYCFSFNQIFSPSDFCRFDIISMFLCLNCVHAPH